MEDGGGGSAAEEGNKVAGGFGVGAVFDDRHRISNGGMAIGRGGGNDLSPTDCLVRRPWAARETRDGDDRGLRDPRSFCCLVRSLARALFGPSSVLDRGSFRGHLADDP